MKAAALEEDKDSWMDDAVATIIGIAEVQSQFSADDLDREMRAPGSSKWPGAAFLKASKEGYIQGVEGDLYKKSSRPSRKGSAIKLWMKKKAERS